METLSCEVIQCYYKPQESETGKGGWGLNCAGCDQGMLQTVDGSVSRSCCSLGEIEDAVGWS